MKTFQSVIERLLYVTLLLSVLVNVGLGLVLYCASRRLDNQTTQVESYMHCIVLVFTRQDRANLIVSNIDNCSLTRK